MKLPFRRDTPAPDSPWGRRIAMGVVWTAFLVMAFDCVGKHLKYRGVETWPSVEAALLDAWSGTHTVSTVSYGKSGQSGGTSVEFGGVHFQYTVNGVRYDGHTATPDGHRLPSKKPFEPWRAYYDPESPGTAVLGPYPYHGGFLPMVLCVTGAFLAMHLYFTFFPPKPEPAFPPPPSLPVPAAPPARPGAERSASMRRRSGRRTGCSWPRPSSKPP